MTFYSAIHNYIKYNNYVFYLSGVRCECPNTLEDKVYFTRLVEFDNNGKAEVLRTVESRLIPKLKFVLMYGRYANKAEIQKYRDAIDKLYMQDNAKRRKRRARGNS